MNCQIDAHSHIDARQAKGGADTSHLVAVHHNPQQEGIGIHQQLSTNQQSMT